MNDDVYSIMTKLVLIFVDYLGGNFFLFRGNM